MLTKIVLDDDYFIYLNLEDVVLIKWERDDRRDNSSKDMLCYVWFRIDKNNTDVISLKEKHGLKFLAEYDKYLGNKYVNKNN